MQSWELNFAYGPEGETEKNGKKRFSLRDDIRVFKTSDGRPVSVCSDINLPDLWLGVTEERLKKLEELLEKQKTTFSNIHPAYPEFRNPYPSTHDKILVKPVSVPRTSACYLS